MGNELTRRIYASRGSEQVANINSIPLIVLPGVMGSRLRIKNGRDTVYWDPNSLRRMFWWWEGWHGAETKGKVLDYTKPADVLRDNDDLSPDQVAKGWGTIVWSVYADLLKGLEKFAAEVETRTGISLPVYAIGYDWRQPIEVSSNYVCEQINKILNQENSRRIIIITHSMGGLVARAMLKNFSDISSKTLGVIHIMQPVNGAPAMYRLFWTEEGEEWFMKAILSEPFAQMVRKCPGPFYLLPTHNYASAIDHKIDENKWIWPVPKKYNMKKINDSTTGKENEVPAISRGYIPGKHYGIDILSINSVDMLYKSDTPIVAAKSGTIVNVTKGCKNDCKYNKCDRRLTYERRQAELEQQLAEARKRNDQQQIKNIQNELRSLPQILCGGGYGNRIIIRHEGNMWSLYAHCTEIIVNVGDYVVAGQQIATMGDTGHSSGAHLHFEIIESKDDPTTRNFWLPDRKKVPDPNVIQYAYIDEPIKNSQQEGQKSTGWLVVNSREIESDNIYETYVSPESDARLTQWGFKEDIEQNVRMAKEFHSKLGLYKHPNTWSIYSTGIGTTDAKCYINKQDNKVTLKRGLDDGDGTVPDISAAALFPGEANEVRDLNELMNYLKKGKHQFVVRDVKHSQPGHASVMWIVQGIINYMLDFGHNIIITQSNQSQSEKLKELEEALQHPNVRAMLQVIRYGEGTTGDKGYRMLFGGETFNDFTKHPNKTIRKGGYITTAAGAYQFLASTWQELVNQYGFQDFSPHNQDLGAVALIKKRGALEYVKSGRFREAIKRISWEWASLPGPDGKSRYGQPAKSIEELEKIYKNNGGQVSD
jgi:muramidase (phage lysozyme)/murein DD-endopeptidase MepM/ murein hydrolase activator NlpD